MSYLVSIQHYLKQWIHNQHYLAIPNFQQQHRGNHMNCTVANRHSFQLQRNRKENIFTTNELILFSEREKRIKLGDFAIP